jgi:hypothetical protein
MPNSQIVSLPANRNPSANSNQSATAHKPRRKAAARRNPFQRWLAETQAQEINLDQRVLDLCG